VTLDIRVGDCRELLREMPAGSVRCCVTSPPYWGLRDYGTATWEGGDAACDHVAQRKPPTVGSSSGLGFPADGGPRRIAEGNTYHEAYTAQYRDACGKCGAVRVDAQLGLEKTPEEYVAKMADVFREVRRVLADDGTVWLNLGDSYASAPAGNSDATFSAKQASNRGNSLRRERSTIAAGLKPKDLVGIPWRVAFALQADGWYLRSDIIWAKPNPMPESVSDRPTKAHEYLFLLAKSQRYYYDAAAIAEPYTNSTVERMRYSAIPVTGKSVANIMTGGEGDKVASGVTRTTAGLVSHEAKDNGGRNRRTV